MMESMGPTIAQKVSIIILIIMLPCVLVLLYLTISKSEKYIDTHGMTIKEARGCHIQAKATNTLDHSCPKLLD